MVDDHDEATQVTVVPRYGHPAIGSGQYIDSGRNKLRQRQHGHVDSASPPMTDDTKVKDNTKVKQDNKDHQPIKRQVAGTAGLRRAVSGRSTAAGSHSTIRPIAAISIATHPAWSAAFRRSSAILSSPWSGGRLRVSATGVRHLPSPHRVFTNAESLARSSTTAQPAPPSTQRSNSHLHEEVTAGRRARLCYSTRGAVDVGDGISDRSSSHEVHAISAEQGGEHVDDIIVVLDDDQRPTGKFRKLGRFHGPARDHSS
jgi:hypothetical protein